MTDYAQVTVRVSCEHRSLQYLHAVAGRVARLSPEVFGCAASARARFGETTEACCIPQVYVSINGGAEERFELPDDYVARRAVTALLWHK